MTRIVVDASVLLRAVLPGQDAGGLVQRAIQAAMEAGGELVAPDLLSYEVGHAARRVQDDIARDAVLPRILEVTTLLRPSASQHRAAQHVARDHDVSFYDASYIALARAIGAPLWTEDKLLLQTFPDVAVDTSALPLR